MQDEMQYKTFPSALYPIYTDRTTLHKIRIEKHKLKVGCLQEWTTTVNNITDLRQLYDPAWPRCSWQTIPRSR